MDEPRDEPEVDRFHRRFSAGRVLYYAGAPATELYLIRRGRVRLMRRARGLEHSVGVHGPDEIVGEEALLTGAYRACTAQAIEPVNALVIDSDTFRALVRARPELGDRTMQQLVRRLVDMQTRIESARVPDPTVRVLNTLLRGPGEADSPLELSPLELSNRTALSLEQVKAVVGQLADRGYLSTTEQRITLDDPSMLQELHDLLSIKEEVRHRLACR